MRREQKKSLICSTLPVTVDLSGTWSGVVRSNASIRKANSIGGSSTVGWEIKAIMMFQKLLFNELTDLIPQALQWSRLFEDHMYFLVFAKVDSLTITLLSCPKFR